MQEYQQMEVYRDNFFYVVYGLVFVLSAVLNLDDRSRSTWVWLIPMLFGFQYGWSILYNGVGTRLESWNQIMNPHEYPQVEEDSVTAEL